MKSDYRESFFMRLRQIVFTISRKMTSQNSLSGPSLALQWLRDHELPSGGIRVHNTHPCSYPEVTGYLVPTMLAYGEKAMASRSVAWLVSIQTADGSYADSEGRKSYVFDTGQVLRGLLAGMHLVPEARTAAMRACDWLCGQMISGGAGGFPHDYDNFTYVSESVQLYVLPALFEASDFLQLPDCRASAEKCLDFYLQKGGGLAAEETLTHFLAYEIEALIDMGKGALVEPLLQQLETLQSSDGSVRGIGGVRWVCVPGLLQIAICWYKTGRYEAADRAMQWIESHQRKSGGFLGSHGFRSWYFPRNEPAWAVKYYLDANFLRVRSFFDRNAHMFPVAVPDDDGRLQAILSVLQPGYSILEVGCGKGRFLAALCRRIPNLNPFGVDLSPALLKYVPDFIERREGSMEVIPFPDNTFDLVFSVEAIEHSANTKAAISEMIRVTRPGGQVIIIDKQKSHWGRLKCTSWERWPEINELSVCLGCGCTEVSAIQVAYDSHAAKDGMMVAWRGRKQ